MSNAENAPVISMTHTNGDELKIATSGAPAFFTCRFWLDLHDQVTSLSNCSARGKQLVVPADTPWSLCASSAKPDVFMVAFHMPEHPEADRNGLIGVVLRDASWRKLQANAK